MAAGAPAGASSKAQEEGRTVVWVAESGFYQLPAVVRTHAPRGATPILHAPLTRDHRSVIGGVTSAGRLLVQLQERPYREPTIVGYLRHLLRHTDGKLLAIWDEAPIHRSQPVKEFLATEQGKRIQFERLPGYAPEVSRDEGSWQHLKRVELRKVVCHSLAELKTELRLAIARLRHKRHVSQGCYHVLWLRGLVIHAAVSNVKRR